MPERARTDLWEPQGSNSLGPPGPSRRLLGVLRPDQGFQQVVEIAFDPLAEHEPMITGEAAGVVARPEDQVVSLGDHDQFLVFFH